MTPVAEKRLLQIAVTVGCAVPLAGGLLGIVQGGQWLGQRLDVTLDSHFRYLSGLLLAIGLAFLSTVPRIETHTRTFTVLTTLVVVGGCARLLGIVMDGWPAPTMIFAQAMELGITPSLWLWQRRIAALLAIRSER